MKLIDLSTFEQDKITGWSLDVLKFSRKSVITIECENSTYRDNPSVLLQIGPSDLLYVSLGLIKFIFTITIWGRHFDY